MLRQLWEATSGSAIGGGHLDASSLQPRHPLPPRSVWCAAGLPRRMRRFCLKCAWGFFEIFRFWSDLGHRCMKRLDYSWGIPQLSNKSWPQRRWKVMILVRTSSKFQSDTRVMAMSTLYGARYKSICTVFLNVLCDVEFIGTVFTANHISKNTPFVQKS